jgi:hypothetical protein
MDAPAGQTRAPNPHRAAFLPASLKRTYAGCPHQPAPQEPQKQKVKRWMLDGNHDERRNLTMFHLSRWSASASTSAIAAVFHAL